MNNELPKPRKRRKNHSAVTKEFLMENSVRDDATYCWNWTRATSKGYGRVWDGEQFRQAHVVSYELFVGPVPEGHFVCHKCDNRKCIFPDHLFVGTQFDNMRDASAKGRVVIPNKKLTREQVLEIRNSSLGYRKLFKTGRFPIGMRGIQKVRDGETYAQVV